MKHWAQTSESGVNQTVVRGGSPSGPQAVSEEKTISKIVSGTEWMRNHTCMSVLKLPLLVDLQQKVGELVLYITSCPSVIISENTLISA
jgi:hypothetical protein